MTGYKVIVNKSTVPVGTASLVKEKIQECLKNRKADIPFDVVSNPEFLKEGSAIDDFMRPDRIVVGLESERAQKLMARLYEPFVRNGHPILYMDPFSSEMTKYAANSLLATKISFINEISRVCEKLGADVEKVRKGIGADKRIGYHFIYPGLGYGGSCFPKDVKALLKTGRAAGEPMHILEAVENVNQLQRNHYIKRVSDFFGNQLKGKKVAVWGLAFKPGTDDIREAPAIDIIQSLLDGGATVHAYDPVAEDHVKAHFNNNPRLEFAKEQYGALEKADALCLVTEWKSFREPDFEKMKAKMQAPVIFDGRNQYEPETMKAQGFKYFCIGRKSV
jgi:UDPglucose 6-dehydrogenase